MPQDQEPTTAEEHWASRDPEGQPPRAAVLGLPRMVLESRSRRGPAATPAEVCEELHAAGVAVTVDEVKGVWT
ncbi:MAG: hypothetical protein ABGY75_05955 [Gemmataceae bacterium]